MRGKTFIDRARRTELADRHGKKFHLYPQVCTIVDKFMRGATVATLVDLTRSQFNTLSTFYGITLDPGPRADVTPLRCKGKRLYAPRPKSYRKGTPIVMRARYRKQSDRTTAALRTLDEAVTESGVQPITPMGLDRHNAVRSAGWILVAEFAINPYLREDNV